MIYLGGGSIEQSARGEPITDTNFLWLVNAGSDTTSFTLPAPNWGEVWRVALDTTTGDVDPLDTPIRKAGESIEIIDHSLLLLEHVGQ